MDEMAVMDRDGSYCPQIAQMFADESKGMNKDDQDKTG